jgi:hypothetical protein
VKTITHWTGGKPVGSGSGRYGAGRTVQGHEDGFFLAAGINLGFPDHS